MSVSSIGSSVGKVRPQVSIPKSSPIYSLRSSSSTLNGSAVSLSSLFAGTAISLPRDAIDDIKSVVHHAFVPHIAVHVSDDTTELVREKGFFGFTQLLRPYGENIQGRITVRDSQGSSMTMEDFGVRFNDLMNLGEQTIMSPGTGTPNSMHERSAYPSSKESAAKIEVVEKLLDMHLTHNEELIEASLASETDSHQSFYLLYLKKLLSGLYPSNYETFAHPVACLIAISSRNTSPIESLRKLYKSGSEVHMPHFVNREYLRYYVLVHDEDKDDFQKSSALFEQMKRHFGLHCHLIRLRSAACVVSDEDAVPVPVSQWVSAAEELVEINNNKKDWQDDDEQQPTKYLTSSDESAIRTMIREMVAQSVIPFMERNIATWNDQVLSRRKGLSGRVTSFTRRFLGGTSSRGAASSAAISNYDSMSASYDPSTPEAQMRKLADFAFMLRDWRLAHSVFDLLRSDFNNDKAWMHLAGAQEMTIVSLLLSGQPISSKVRSDIIDVYLDSACYSFMTRCAAPYSALRCLLVVVELLRLTGGSCTGLAAKWAIKAVEMKPKLDIGRALITQRVGDCYAMRQGAGSGGWGGRRRKAAMWHTLAADTWVRLGKYAQARRCIDDVQSMYLNTTFAGIHLFLEQIKVDSGYSTLLDIRGDVEEDGAVEEEETLHLGRRKSLMIAPEADDSDAPAPDDDFIAS